MEEERTDNPHDDNPYTEEEFQLDLIHSDVVMAYQNMMSKRLGRPVSYTEAEGEAY